MRSPHNAQRLWRFARAFVKGFSAPTLLLVPLFTASQFPGGAMAQVRFQPQESTVLLRAEVTRESENALRNALQRWRASPKDLQVSTAAARTAILAAMRQGDLRWLGNAKAMLEPWWNSQEIPSETLFVRALIRQGTHDFVGALADLDAAIAKDPQQPEFWAWRFALYMVKAEITKARDECAAIGSRFGSTEQSSCDAVLLYRTGRPQQAIQVLDRLSRHADYQGANAKEWLAFHSGEARRVAGNLTGARKIWESHIRAGTAGHGLRVALIELLNSQGLYHEAWKLNDKPPRSDALLVAAIQTAQALNNSQAPTLVSELTQRLRQQTARGDSTNERPMIKYQLLIQKDAKAALRMAKIAWKTEREPADAHLYAQAAIASGIPDQAVELLQWQSETGYREPVLDRLLTQIEQAAARKK